MLDIKLIRENPSKIKEGCQKKRIEADIDKLLEVDRRRRELLREVEDLRAKRNDVSNSIPRVSEEEKEELISQMKKITVKIKKIEPELKKLEKEFTELMFQLPNMPLDDVPEGKDESENQVIRVWGEPQKFCFKPKNHLEIGRDLDLIDTERAAKVSGSRFGYLKNKAVLLEFALINFAFDILVKEGFTPLIPPVLLKEKAMRAMGYLERGEEEIYRTDRDNMYLVGTSEQSVGPMHMNEIFSLEELPRRYVAFSTCFRREAGSYGKDTRGIMRVHQFDKVEMFSFCEPSKSKGEHSYLLSMEEKIVQALKIPYRVVKMCTGDLGNPAAAKYDIECWMPGENQYRETHSTSNCTDFQARRLNIRFRGEKKGELEYVHTLNGTALAIGRTIIAILENYQREDGSIEIPLVLRPYMGGNTKIC
ncbi:serine--tRNA ligase [Candidatus Aerophobetes bacterium]|nr:serine--tRNA ligase [Candidatus Aerophobetes bacterium]